MHTLSNELETVLSTDPNGVVSIPALVKGQLLFPRTITIDKLIAASEQAVARKGVGSDSGSQWFKIEDVQVIRRPIYDRSTLLPTGEDQFLVLPSFAPRSLLETDHSELVRGLYSLPFSEIMAYVGKLRDVLRVGRSVVKNAAYCTKATSLLDDRVYDILFNLLPTLLDPEALAEAVDRELSGAEAPGRQYLDGWIQVHVESHRGMTARMSDQLFARTEGAARGAFTPMVRAIPTRQLHITAGNSPLVPFLSFLRALATKSAAVIKSPAEGTTLAAVLAVAMRAVDPNHPITRHTSLVYWKGGERSVEDTLFAPGAFDRVIVWGSPETVQSIGERVRHTRTVFLNPRYSVSLIGRQAFPDHVVEVAIRAATDSMIANQQACTSSLVHYVEASEAEALEYCRALKTVLAQWDHYLPHKVPRTTLGRLRLLRRNAFLHGSWFENGTPPDISSLVVYMPEAFDLSAHPMSRCIIVRRVDHFSQAFSFLNSAVAAVGVYPEEVREALRDEMAAAGVSNILPLGECEHAYAGMPHDGMRVLSELVNWTNA